jgi:hypothetical protein
VAKGRAHSHEGIPQGLADPSKDFAGAGEWFCWVAFERLMARCCCEIWLRSAAEQLDGNARKVVLDAAESYGEAFQCYDHYRSEVGAGEPSPPSNEERARTPDRIAVTAGILERGIAAEAAGLDALAQAVN